jgi:hypothetical protein
MVLNGNAPIFNFLSRATADLQSDRGGGGASSTLCVDTLHTFFFFLVVSRIHGYFFFSTPPLPLFLYLIMN